MTLILYWTLPTIYILLTSGSVQHNSHLQTKKIEEEEVIVILYTHNTCVHLI